MSSLITYAEIHPHERQRLNAVPSCFSLQSRESLRENSSTSKDDARLIATSNAWTAKFWNANFSASLNLKVYVELLTLAEEGDIGETLTFEQVRE